MEHFTLKGESGFVKITLGEAFGFTTQADKTKGVALRSLIVIKSFGYSAKGAFWTTSGEIIDFYNNLKNAHEKISGSVTYLSYEQSVQLELFYSDQGQVNIAGKYKERKDLNNWLHFVIKSDQSYITYTINELRSLIEKFEKK